MIFTTKIKQRNYSMKDHSNTPVEFETTEHEVANLIDNLYNETISQIDSEIEEAKCLLGPERTDAVFRLLSLKVTMVSNINVAISSYI